MKPRTKKVQQGASVDKTTIKIRGSAAKPRNPVLVVGLPGVGSVGKMVVDHLIKESRAKRIATLYSPHFPHYVVMTKKGGVRLVSNRFYLLRQKGARSDIIFLTGDFQSITPEGHYEVNDKIVSFFKETLNGKFIYTLGGYNIADGIKEHPRIFGYATSKKVISGLSKDKEILFGRSSGTIMGSAGMLIAFAREKGVDGVCLMGETAFINVDAAAAKAVLAMLTRLLGIKTDTKSFDRLIEETHKAAREIEQQAAGILQQQMGGQSPPPLPSGEKPTYIR
jgi:hypothetical protein